MLIMNRPKKILFVVKNRYAQIPDVFPTDGSNLVIQICQMAKSPNECKGNPMLETERAHSIARRFFNATFSR